MANDWCVSHPENGLCCQKSNLFFRNCFQSLYLYCISVYCFPFVFNLFSCDFVFVSCAFYLFSRALYLFSFFLSFSVFFSFCFFPVLLYLYLCFRICFLLSLYLFSFVFIFSPWDFVSFPLGFCIVLVLSKIVSQPLDIPCSANRWSVNNVFSKWSSHCQKNHQEEP